MSQYTFTFKKDDIFVEFTTTDKEIVEQQFQIWVADADDYARGHNQGKGKTVRSEELGVRSDFVASQRNLTNQSSDNSTQKTPNSSLLTPNYYILDYKTGKIPPNAEQDFQTIVYLLCVDKFLKRKNGYNSLKFVYLGLKENKQKEILLTPDLKQQYEEKIIQTCKQIDLAVYSNVFSQNKERCVNCEYNKFCEN